MLLKSVMKCPGAPLRSSFFYAPKVRVRKITLTITNFPYSRLLCARREGLREGLPSLVAIAKTSMEKMARCAFF